MKGKISVRFCMPNVQRFRSRVENPSKELTSELRDLLSQVVCDVMNGQQLQIRAKFIEAVAEKGLTFKSAAHEAKVMSVVESFFDTVFAPTPEALDELVGAETEEEVETEQSEGEGKPEDFND